MPCQAQKRSARMGVTLVELLLVLTLLVVIASLAVPIVNSAFASVRLRRASDQVLAAWSQARTDAIDDGIIRQFRFIPREGRYRVEPWLGIDVDGQSVAGGANSISRASSAAALPTAAAPAGLAASSDVAATQDGVESNLPDQATFYRGQRAVDSRPGTEASLVELESPSGPGGAATWSEPILFFPDGTASDASVVIANDLKQVQRLTLRGLSGVASVSLVLDAEELERMQSR